VLLLVVAQHASSVQQCCCFRQGLHTQRALVVRLQHLLVLCSVKALAQVETAVVVDACTMITLAVSCNGLYSSTWQRL
jgi:hypothetical protein